MPLSIFEHNPTAVAIVSLAIIMVAGFLMSRLTKLLKLPNVTGYILAGVLIGPYVFKIIPQSIIPNFDIITDIAIAFIAFGVGRYLNISALKNNGKRNFFIALLETLFAGILVFAIMKFAFNCSYQLSIVLGAIASTTAPTSTLMTIRQYRAKGTFIDTLIQVIALDNAVAIILFNVSLILGQIGTGLTTLEIILPLVYNFALIGIGIGLGFLLKKLINNKFSMDSRLIMTFAVIISLCAICSLLNISPLLSCMALGATYVSAKGDTEMFKVVGSFTPPILLVFFVYSGMSLNLNLLLSLGLMGIAYFIIRILGKMLGSFTAGKILKMPKEVGRYLGLALIPQAGVSISLAMIAQRVLPDETGFILTTVILSSAILYELIGPALAKYSIFASGSISEKNKKTQKLTPLEIYLKEHLENSIYGEITQISNKEIKNQTEKANKQKILNHSNTSIDDKQDNNISFDKNEIIIEEDSKILDNNKMPFQCENNINEKKENIFESTELENKTNNSFVQGNIDDK